MNYDKNHDILTPEEQIALLKAYKQDHDEEAKERLVACNIRLVNSVINDMGVPQGMYEDIFQDGLVGLLEAIERYDPDSGNALSTYALYWIRSSIQDGLCSSTIVPIPRATRVFIGKMHQFEAEYLATHDAMPSIEETAKALGCPKDKVLDAYGVRTQIVSLSTTVGEDDDQTYEDLLGEKDPEPTFDAEKVRETFAKASKVLTEKQRELIVRALGLDGKAPESLADIGRRMGFSRQRAHQNFNKAITKIRPMFEAASPR